jgi:CYTH domain-containing protein
MPVEIERKFLVRRLPKDLSKHKSHKIIQGYTEITEDGTETRLRQKENAYTQTVKSGKGLERQEVETELTEGQFSKLWPNTKGKRVEKMRFDLPYKDWIIEVDVYEGALEGLVTAEVEFSSREEAESFTPPDWMNQEVTQDDRYKNKNLALHGLPSAKKQGQRKS